MTGELPFPAGSEFSGFNAITTFAPEVRSRVLQALENAKLPTKAEIGGTDSEVDIGPWVLAAINFAGLIDPNFNTRRPLDCSPQTEAAKLRFFKMIHNLSSEQVAAAVKEIKEKGLILQQPVS